MNIKHGNGKEGNLPADIVLPEEIKMKIKNNLTK